MDTPQTTAALLARIERAMQRVADAIAPLPPARLEQPLLAGGRSVKDVLGHMTWWDQWLLTTLPPGAGDQGPPIALPLADQIPATHDWADELNAKVHAYNQRRGLAAIQAEYEATRERLLRRVSELTLEDLYDPHGISATIGQPLAPLVLGIYEHYEEHAHEFEQL